MNLEAVNQFIGSRWVYSENDCWAVFCKASAAVFGVPVYSLEIPAESDPQANSFLFDNESSGKQWISLEEPVPGCAVLFRDNRGVAVHVGLYVTDGNILHCPGSTEKPGTTRYEPIRLLRRVFKSLEFYRYAPDHDNS